VPAEITIVGARPHRPGALPPHANYVGTFDKRSRGSAELGELIGGAHFLLLPTRADCSPVVFAEASAWGTPSLAPDVGGVGEMVVDWVNGRLLEQASGPEKYASAILAAFEDPTAYRELALSSRQEYDRRLNWKTAGEQMVRLLEGVAAPAA
jgi:glycosyltransferase involved in cell wall biosynthesis